MAVHRDLLEVAACELLRHRAEVVLDAGELMNGIDLHAAHALRGEHPVCRVRIDDLGDEQPRELRERAPEDRRVAGLDAVVELIDERALELLDDADHVDALAHVAVRSHEAGELAKERDVVREDLANPGALYLDDNRATIAEARCVRLAEAGRRQRPGLEGGEQLAHAAVQLLVNRALDILEGDLADIVLEPGELPDIGRREEIGTGRENLT